jgi:hypothetical protein
MTGITIIVSTKNTKINDFISLKYASTPGP